MNRVVMLSGGVASWCAGKRVAARYGTDGLVLLFADTKVEDSDTYRFLREAAANIGGTLVEIADGRTIWEVFRDERFLGNSRVDPCSRVLKREVCDRWIAAHYAPDDVVIYVGIDWSESHRYVRLRDRKLPWVYEAPLLEAPYLTKNDMHDWAKREGLKKQRLYVLGAAHANCGGGCVKMGVGGFARLYRSDPDTFAQWEANEQAMRDQLGDVSILKDGVTLRALRARLDANETVDLFDIGGCACLSEPEV